MFKAGETIELGRCGVVRGEGEGDGLGHEGGVEEVDGVDVGVGCLGGLGGADDDEDAGAVWEVGELVRGLRGGVFGGVDLHETEHGCGVEGPGRFAAAGDVADYQHGKEGEEDPGEHRKGWGC